MSWILMTGTIKWIQSGIFIPIEKILVIRNKYKDHCDKQKAYPKLSSCLFKYWIIFYPEINC